MVIFIFDMIENIVRKKEKMLLISIFSFTDNVLKSPRFKNC